MKYIFFWVLFAANPDLTNPHMVITSGSQEFDSEKTCEYMVDYYELQYPKTNKDGTISKAWCVAK